MLKKIGIALIALLLVIILATVASIAWLSESNIPDRDRDIGDAAVLAMLNDEVRVKRDRQGVPYIYAQTLADALRVQGFVTAQDRLSQMLLTRELIHGRLSEQIGEAGLRSDTLVRIMGLSRMGSVWAAQLESPSRELHEWFLEGVNAYIATQADEFPLAVRISGEPPAPFTLDDFTTQYLFLAFNSTGNWRTEVLSQALVDHLGAGKAAEISMLTVNPDDESEWASDYSLAENRMPESDPASFPELPEPSDGSNSWATSARRSAGGAPIVANDPHIDVRRLPSIWHPVALITPEWRAVGTAGAGLPGMGVGRSSDVAWGITNAFSDVADLFIERDDPDRPGHYLEGE
ncbi:MAG: penicillin acylase family protein, partial [Gammaproteobacteria bacterium]|nr:penicillin acylase family protein [Gammaproteobacteria bacterium]